MELENSTFIKLNSKVSKKWGAYVGGEEKFKV